MAAHLPTRRTVSQLHWGGGTPTFLDERQLARCHEILARHFAFGPDAEKAIEIDPAITTRSQIETLAGLGFNRISMGVQDFDERVQQAVGRIQGEKETADLVQAAREQRLRRREPGPHLRPALPDPRDLAADAGADPGHPARPDGGVRLRLRALGQAAPAAPAAGGAARDRAAGGAVPGGGGGVHEGRLPAHRAGPLRAGERRAGPRAGGRHPVSATSRATPCARPTTPSPSA